MRAHAGAQRAIKVQKQNSRRDREALGRSSQQVGGPFTACFQTDRVACTPHQIKEKFQICCLQIKRSGNCFASDFQASDFSHGCSDGGVCRLCLQPGCLPGCKDLKKKSDKKPEKRAGITGNGQQKADEESRDQEERCRSSAPTIHTSLQSDVWKTL